MNEKQKVVKEKKAGAHKAWISGTVLHLYVVLGSLGSFTELQSIKSPEVGSNKHTV